MQGEFLLCISVQVKKEEQSRNMLWGQAPEDRRGSSVHGWRGSDGLAERLVYSFCLCCCLCGASLLCASPCRSREKCRAAICCGARPQKTCGAMLLPSVQGEASEDMRGEAPETCGARLQKTCGARLLSLFVGRGSRRHAGRGSSIHAGRGSRGHAEQSTYGLSERGESLLCIPVQVKNEKQSSAMLRGPGSKLQFQCGAKLLKTCRARLLSILWGEAPEDMRGEAPEDMRGEAPFYICGARLQHDMRGNGHCAYRVVSPLCIAVQV